MRVPGIADTRDGSVDCTDDGTGKRADRGHGSVCGIDGGRCRPVVRRRGRQVGTGAERAPGAGEDGRADRRIAGTRLEGVCDRVERFDPHCIHARRPVEGDTEEVSVEGGYDA